MGKKKKYEDKKVCYIQQQGGHYAQLMQLSGLMKETKSLIVTENIGKYADKPGEVYYIKQVNRKEKDFMLLMIVNQFKSLYILIKERPDVIIQTGVLATIPLCILGKYLFRAKLIYIESFAKTRSPNATGRLMYKMADYFFVQHESMIQIYPDAIYEGGIYG